MDHVDGVVLEHELDMDVGYGVVDEVDEVAVGVEVVVVDEVVVAFVHGMDVLAMHLELEQGFGCGTVVEEGEHVIEKLFHGRRVLWCLASLDLDLDWFRQMVV